MADSKSSIVTITIFAVTRHIIVLTQTRSQKVKNNKITRVIFTKLSIRPRKEDNTNNDAVPKKINYANAIIVDQFLNNANVIVFNDTRMRKKSNNSKTVLKSLIRQKYKLLFKYGVLKEPPIKLGLIKQYSYGIHITKHSSILHSLTLKIN